MVSSFQYGLSNTQYLLDEACKQYLDYFSPKAFFFGLKKVFQMSYSLFAMSSIFSPQIYSGSSLCQECVSFILSRIPDVHNHELFLIQMKNFPCSSIVYHLCCKFIVPIILSFEYVIYYEDKFLFLHVDFLPAYMIRVERQKYK